jgi:hypothetical protein
LRGCGETIAIGLVDGEHDSYLRKQRF